ncbi:MAG: hypothetical protein ABIB98_02435 [bacterium]
MQQNPEGIIVELLNIIGYTSDKQKFANEFLDCCKKKAFLELINTLSEEEREALNKQIKEEGEQFNNEKYNQTVKKVVEDTFKAYVQTITPNLTKIQLENLQLFFKRLAPTSQ